MIRCNNRRQLVEFEKEIARLYDQAKIRAPIHLSRGNEIQLVKIFNNFKEGDWIVSTHRNHYHWLLSGRDPGQLKNLVLDGHSMHVFDKKFFTSAIVSGNAPIALGIAMAMKIRNSRNRVWCFVGDMAGESGLVYESVKYAKGHNLPVTFIIEDNGYSVRAITKETWGSKGTGTVRRYKYKRHYPHSGTGKYVMF